MKNGNEVWAEKAGLIYANCSGKGITRVRKGNGFIYFSFGRQIRSKNTLKRIEALKIPPAWEQVWICPDKHGHLQATGLDAKNRKQYLYHSKWMSLRNNIKFSTLRQFGMALPKIRKAVNRDLKQKELSESRVLALVIRLMEETYIRVGNEFYEKSNGSYGLTTLKDNHVKLNGTSMRFSFVGKKGIRHNISLHNKKLIRLVKQCRDIPGKELFQYLDADGNSHKIDSGMVNNYIRNISGKPFTAKDFRTWAGSVIALDKIMEYKQAGVEIKSPGMVNEILDYVSSKLGNTRAICKKYYVHDAVLALASGNITIQQVNSKPSVGISPAESLLLRILKTGNKGV
jgi:DNA topoisomerase-1